MKTKNVPKMKQQGYVGGTVVKTPYSQHKGSRFNS